MSDHTPTDVIAGEIAGYNPERDSSWDYAREALAALVRDETVRQEMVDAVLDVLPIHARIAVDALLAYLTPPPAKRSIP